MLAGRLSSMNHHLRRASKVLAAISGVLISGQAQYAVARDHDACTVRDKNGSVVIIVCPPDLGPQQWHEAAETACANVNSCSAWIWDNPKKAPQKAPPIATGFAKKDVLSSVAIWDNTKKELMTIKRVKKSH
jgi:hypothetical protein